jgi:hypothetical protein
VSGPRRLEGLPGRSRGWEPEGGRLRVLFEMVKGMIRGQRADETLNPPKSVQ